MKTCRWSSPVLGAPSVSSELTLSMNGAVTLAPVAGETIVSVGPLLPAFEPAEAVEPPDPEEPLEVEGVLVPHAARASSAAAPAANTNVRWDRICAPPRDLPGTSRRHVQMPHLVQRVTGTSYRTGRQVPRRMARRVMMDKKISTIFSQEHPAAGVRETRRRARD